MLDDRILYSDYRDKLMSAKEAASFIKDGMTIGMSGFTKSGDAKAVPMEMAKLAQQFGTRVNLLTGASLGHELDGILANAGAIEKRMPFQADAGMRKAINRGELNFVDQHLSHTAEMLQSGQMRGIDIAVIEAAALLEDGSIVPTTSVGNSALFVHLADKVIIELNESQPMELRGLHDIYMPGNRPGRQPIRITRPEDRIGTESMHVNPDKVVGVVVTNQRDDPSTVLPPDYETEQIAGHLLDFFTHELRMGRLSQELLPLQSGIGTTANAVLRGFLDSPFHHLKMYSEVLQDSVIDLFNSGRMDFASASSITLSKPMAQQFFDDLSRYKEKLVLRPQEISNHPEVIRRLGVIAINTALEVDLYGNVNSTHVAGTQMMNGIGGSGDFARNSYLSVFVTKSIAKDGKISSVVPMATHVDHTEHDVDVIVTEQGLADLRGLSPRERVSQMIEHCAHPDYRTALWDYYKSALKHGGQTPHDLEHAFVFHQRYSETQSMLPVRQSATV
ncbi:acetyl-CoA hydrolase/transferase family protein [Alicyclobacillus sp. SO9]|uniref:acetyl-CoA hydrolase/transferase family protein n=1 Tax=Alicyclobacillus sp. SO9 TaxID=2665646 RepID=UPI0018E8EBEB|nr:acetyl-CoA hydrolase/transferase family protein [Alicyclobacillus sp. SO9]QQE80643.1 acetyl-CoA hydrolase/transferase family protein [Alicyclobacillus sp. SO9]